MKTLSTETIVAVTEDSPDPDGAWTAALQSDHVVALQFTRSKTVQAAAAGPFFSEDLRRLARFATELAEHLERA